jgi:hypothetical protein
MPQCTSTQHNNKGKKKEKKCKQGKTSKQTKKHLIKNNKGKQVSVAPCQLLLQ